MPGEYGDDDLESSEPEIIDVIYPQDPKEATHILERWRDFEYVEVGRAHSEEEARRKAQEIANQKEVSIQIRLKHSWED